MRPSMFAAVVLLLGCTAGVAAQTAPAGVVEYYHVDALGSVRAVTSATGAVVRTHHYHPFGEGVESGADPMRFTGKPRDGETGLDYFGARYHATRPGRFSTVDPLLDADAALDHPQRWNRYAYALNNPHRYIDPTGEVPILVAAAAMLGTRYLATPQGQRVALLLSRYGQQLGSFALTRGRAISTEVFRLGPVVRGRVIESLSGAPDAFRNVRAIDNFVDGIAVSIKSVDIFAKSYQSLSRLESVLMGHAERLATYAGGAIPGGVIRASDVHMRVLQVVIPQGALTPAQQQLLLKVQGDAAAMGVQVVYRQAK